MRQLSSLSRLRIGIGFDAHNLKKGRRFVLGGVTIRFSHGLAGHSDGDVLLHAVTDALLGAAALPDIGTLFPDTDPRFKNADSAALLSQVCAVVRKRGWRPAGLDCVVVCDRPALAPHALAIRSKLGRLLSLKPEYVGFKAKTTEGTNLAIPGRSVAALATVLLRKAT